MKQTHLEYLERVAVEYARAVVGHRGATIRAERWVPGPKKERAETLRRRAQEKLRVATIALMEAADAFTRHQQYMYNESQLRMQNRTLKEEPMTTKTVVLTMTERQANLLREALGETRVGLCKSTEEALMVHATYWQLLRAHQGHDSETVKCDAGGARIDMTRVEL